MIQMTLDEIKPDFTIYDSYKPHQVQAESVEDFLNRYYRHDRYKGRGKEYEKSLLESNRRDFDKLGFCCISAFDSVTGNPASYYG